MIRHAGLRPAPAILPLTIAMIQPSFLTLLVAAIGAATLMPTGVLATGHAAIALTAIATGTDKENGPASGVKTKPLPQNYFVERRHLSSQRVLDNGSAFMPG